MWGHEYVRRFLQPSWDMVEPNPVSSTPVHMHHPFQNKTLPNPTQNPAEPYTITLDLQREIHASLLGVVCIQASSDTSLHLAALHQNPLKRCEVAAALQGSTAQRPSAAEQGCQKRMHENGLKLSVNPRSLMLNLLFLGACKAGELGMCWATKTQHASSAELTAICKPPSLGGSLQMTLMRTMLLQNWPADWKVFIW